MNFSVVVHKRAAKYLKSLPDDQKSRIKETLKKLENGIDKRTDVKKMSGEWKGYYRMRVGDIRIIFWIEYVLKTVYIDHIGSRGDIYKKKSI